MSDRKIAYFDDEVENLKVYSGLLKQKFDVHVFQNPMSYEKTLESANYSAIIIDYYMPIIEGPELYHLIKNHPSYNGCPLIFISSDSSDETKIHSLFTGGEDFISRDMKREEIFLRLEKRIAAFENSAKSLTLGSIIIDTENVTCKLAGEVVDVTLTEYKILRSLIKVYPQIISRDDLTFQTWGDKKVMASTLNTHISNLRLKFSSWDYDIQANKGVGYFLKNK